MILTLITIKLHLHCGDTLSALATLFAWLSGGDVLVVYARTGYQGGDTSHGRNGSEGNTMHEDHIIPNQPTTTTLIAGSSHVDVHYVVGYTGNGTPHNHATAPYGQTALNDSTIGSPPTYALAYGGDDSVLATPGEES